MQGYMFFSIYFVYIPVWTWCVRGRQIHQWIIPVHVSSGSRQISARTRSSRRRSASTYDVRRPLPGRLTYSSTLSSTVARRSERWSDAGRYTCDLARPAPGTRSRSRAKFEHGSRTLGPTTDSSSRPLTIVGFQSSLCRPPGLRTSRLYVTLLLLLTVARSNLNTFDSLWPQTVTIIFYILLLQRSTNNVRNQSYRIRRMRRQWYVVL